VAQQFNSSSMVCVGRRRAARCRLTAETARAGGRRNGEGRGWAGLGRKAERSRLVPKNGSVGHKEDAGQNVNGLQKQFCFFSKIFFFI
jgi:hypothetical protein